MSKDYYTILGVEKSASKDEIKKAYKKLAKKYHPDISKEKDADEKFKEINDAASVLLDDDKKAQYDTYGTVNDNPYQQGGFDPSSFGIDLSDIFNEFFGGFGKRRSQGYEESPDMLIGETIDLEDVYFGKTITVSYSRNIKCDTCHGKGAKDPKDVTRCQTCNGTGVISEVKQSFLGMVKTQRTCPACKGKGQIIKNPCPDCSGNGFKYVKETLEVKIPQGIPEGSNLRVAGKGNYSPTQDQYGDLYIRIRYKPHKTFNWEEENIYTTINLNFTQAILGDKVELEHFGKKISITIPEGTQIGTVLRVKSKGLPVYGRDKHGDLYVKVNVTLPKKPTTKQKELLKDFAKTLKKENFFSKIKNFFE